tara:strand:+ start:306 stop:503 length:198 start_codon:yes stop_codon:yes gene_type:complete
MSSKSRRYVSKDYASAPLFLVNRLNEGSLTSEGPFTDIEKAEDMMHSLLVQGICAWMVSYNEKER